MKGSCRKFVEFQPKFLFGICLFHGKMMMKAFEAIWLFSQGKGKWKKNEKKKKKTVLLLQTLFAQLSILYIWLKFKEET